MKKLLLLWLILSGTASAQVNQVIVRDTFTRGDSGNLGGNWTANSDATTTGTIGIVSNTAKPSVGGNAASFYSAASFTANQYAQVILNASALGTNTHGGGPTVHGSASGYYRLFCNMNNIANNCSIAKVVSGTFTALQAYTVTMASGDLLRLEIVGTTLTGYKNGVALSPSTTDSALATGSPGICAFMAASSPTATQVTWQGGNLVWTRQGTVIPIGSNGGTEEPSVLYDTSPQILSANADGHIWKMWFTSGWSALLTVFYAESADGLTWTQYGSNPVISDGTNQAAHAFIMRAGGTYYAYVGFLSGSSGGTTTAIDVWQSSNGVTGWSKTNTAVIATVGSTWESAEVDDPYVWGSGSSWFMLYQGRSGVPYSVGLATATAPAGPWTKYGSNPVISNGTGDALNGKTVVITGSTSYLWGGTSPQGSNIPTDISLWKSTDPTFQTWTACTKNPVYLRVTSDEGPNSAQGQVADAAVIEPCRGVTSCSLATGTTWMFYDALPTQAAGQIHVNAATAPFHILALTQAIFGDPVSSLVIRRPGTFF